MTTGAIVAAVLSGLFALAGTAMAVAKEIRLAKKTNQREDFKVLHDRTVEQLQRVEARLAAAEARLEELEAERHALRMALQRWELWYEAGARSDPPSFP